MADELFLMQRYLGSDDEGCIDSSEEFKEKTVKFSENNSDEINKEPSRKRQRTSNNIKAEGDNQYVNNTVIHSENLDSIDLKHSNTSSSRKSKNRSRSFEGQTSLEGEDNQLTSDNVHTKLSDSTSSHISSTKKRKKLDPLKEGLDDQTTLEDENKATEEKFNLKNVTEHDETNFCTIGQVKDRSTEKIKPVLPKWLSNPSIIGIDLQEHKIPVSDIPYLDSVSKQNLQEAEISFLFPVQSAVIPWLLQNNQHSLSIRPSDLCVSAPTGSGKTLAFVLPIVQSLKSRVVSAVRALIVLPVSELAIQVYKVFEIFVRNTDLKVILLTGQKSFASEQKALVKPGIRRTLSLVDIIVTTPGRILDHISRTEGFCLDHLRFLVVDEADRMMDDIQKGWLKRIESAVYKNCRPHNCLCFAVGGERVPFVPSSTCHFGYVNEPLQKLLYSATLSHDPEKLHTLSLYKPKLFTTATKSEWIGKCSIPENLTLHYIVCKDETKPLVLSHFIKERQFKRILCFMDSVERAQRLHFILEEMGFLRVREISSINRPVQRKIILEQFSAGKVDLLVCSDLVARGMDIEGVDCVISYDAPLHIKRYVHRIGRTARAGKGGTAVTLLTENESTIFKKMLNSTGMPVPEHVDIDNKDLEMYVDSFQKALAVADSKIRKLKAGTRNPPKENKLRRIQEKPKLQKNSSMLKDTK